MTGGGGRLVAALGQLSVVRVLRGYDLAMLRGDVLAAMTVAVMLVPQSMAYAMLAGLEPVYGLYASIVPLLVYPVFGSSRQLAFGIVALDMLVVASVLEQQGVSTPGQAASLAVLLAALTGAIHLLLGSLRLGFIADFLSRPVVVGFTTAAPILIGLSQLGNLTGMSLPRQSELLGLGGQVIRHIGEVHPASALVGLGAVVWLALGRRFLPSLPHALAVVVLSGLLVYGLDLHAGGVALVGPVDRALPWPELPLFDIHTGRDLLSGAVTLALVQIMTVMSLGRVLANRSGDEFFPNRELVALGTANLAGSLFHSAPVSASFSRTAVNVDTGARTPLANAFAGVLVAVAILAAAGAIAYIPRPALAAIIMVSAFAMISLRETRAIFTVHRSEGWIAVMTMAITLLVGIEEGVILGVIAALLDMLYRQSRPRVAVLAPEPGTGAYRDIHHNPHLEPDPDLLVLRVDGAITFTNAEHIRRLVLHHMDQRQDIDAVIIDGGGINHIDATAIGAFASLLDSLDERDVPLYLTRVKGTARATLTRSELTARIANQALEVNTDRIVRHIEAEKSGRGGTDGSGTGGRGGAGPGGDS